jgi:hypothetical protein
MIECHILKWGHCDLDLDHKVKKVVFDWVSGVK